MGAFLLVGKDAFFWKSVGISLGVIFAVYIGIVSVIFFRKTKTMRSAVFLIVFSIVLVAAEYFVYRFLHNNGFSNEVISIICGAPLGLAGNVLASKIHESNLNKTITDAVTQIIDAVTGIVRKDGEKTRKQNKEHARTVIGAFESGKEEILSEFDKKLSGQKSDSAPPETAHNLPSDPSRFFTGRSAFLEEVRQTLKEKHAVALAGQPGIGKSQVALEYGYQQYQAKTYRYVF
jgi:hypothetical protein